MPRYCAVKACRNRGGTSSRQDLKRISFYPFPLQDKSRLQKWVGNMNRRGWTPSRHQCLCSEHFTQSCFDIRWGIRYLKQTAIPTIFPAADNDGEKNLNTNIQSPTIASHISEVIIEPKESSFYSSTPLILSNSWKPAQRKNSPEPSETGELPLVLRTGIIFQTEEDNRMLAGPDPKQHPSNKLNSEVQADSAVDELCCDAEDADLTDTAASFFEKNSTVCLSEGRTPSNGNHVSVDEHSYCRAEDTDKDHLWCKVLCLNAKILELGRREQSTVAKIQALEKEIALLQRDANRRIQKIHTTF
ncbi:THAP domain-containing protein 5 [Oryzias melastigma]|uniref:THAP domain-containing protein 5 n=1 Tax=Oryzias melastigma TaxID=30732 RepID=A0A3B3C236_ORYME|nr:THAP domain-containing protein 5 [Oryzias melastigma]